MFWQAILPYGSEQPESAEKAFYDVGTYLYTLDAWRSQIEAPIDRKPAWRAYREQLIQTDDDATRQNVIANPLRFSGRWSDESYRFEVDPAPEVIGPQDRYGSVNGGLRFESISGSPENLRFYFDTQIHFGEILFSEFLGSIERFHQLVNYERLDQGTYSEGLQHIDLGESQGSDPIDREVLAQLYRTAPLTMTSFLSFIAFEDQVEFEPYKGRVATRLRIRMRILPDQFERHFPDTYRDFEDALSASSFSVSMLDDQNRLIAKIGYDDEQQAFYADAAIYQGGLIAQLGDGSLSEKLYTPTQIQQLTYQMVFNGKVQAYGLRVLVKDFVIDANYSAATKQAPAQFRFRANQLPRVKVSGALLYILPSWLIDWLIPGSIETLVMEAFDDLVGGNDGKGLVAKLDFPEIDQKQLLHFELVGEVTPKTLHRAFNEESDEALGNRRLYRMLKYAFRRDFADTLERVEAPSASQFQSYFRAIDPPF